MISAAFPYQKKRQRVLVREMAYVEERVTQLINEGHLKVTVGKTFPPGNVQQAHEYSRSGHGRGRIVLLID